MPEEPRTFRNPLLVPLVAACLVCVAEGVIIAFLLGRAGHSAAEVKSNGTAAASATLAAQALPPAGASAAAPPATKPAEAPASTSAIVRGKVHQRVEAGGLAVTVLDVSDKPLNDFLTPPEGQEFADCDVLLENVGQRAMSYWSASIKLQDDQERVFDAHSIAGRGPKLGFGTLVAGGKVRGHMAFDLPKDVKGLRLIVPVASSPEPCSIEIDLGR